VTHLGKGYDFLDVDHNPQGKGPILGILLYAMPLMVICSKTGVNKFFVVTAGEKTVFIGSSMPAIPSGGAQHSQFFYDPLCMVIQS